MQTPSNFYDRFYDKWDKDMLFYDRLCLAMKAIWINEVRKWQDKQGYSIYSAQIPTMKPLD